MPNIPPTFPLSLRAWPSDPSTTTPLSTLIARIAHERGDFRSLTEDSLRAELAKAQNPATPASDQDASSSEDEDEPETFDDRKKAIFEAKQNMLMQIDTAAQSASIALDTLSLLLSKTAPTVAASSISPAVREAFPLGVLGASAVQDSRITHDKATDAKLLTRGWKIQAFDNAVDALLGAATRLEKAVESETKYWEGVLRVDQAGWRTCKLPAEKNTLAVRVGFLDAGPVFRNRSLVPLRKERGGGVYLDGSGVPKRVEVRIETNSVITGRESPAESVAEDGHIEGLVRQARNTLFEEELWFELQREARGLAGQGVEITKDAMTVPLSSSFGSGKSLVISLQPLPTSPLASSAAHTVPVREERTQDDYLAEGISLALHLLLSNAHRLNLKSRSRPPQPMSSRPVPNNPYKLLRPLLARQAHAAAVSTLTSVLDGIHHALCIAALPVEKYSVGPSSSNTLSGGTGTNLSKAEDVIISLLTSFEDVFTLPLPAGQRVQIAINTRSSMIPNFSVRGEGEKGKKDRSGLADTVEWCLFVAANAVAASFTLSNADNSPAIGVDAKHTAYKWVHTSSPGTIRLSGTEGRTVEINFQFRRDQSSSGVMSGVNAIALDGNVAGEVHLHVVCRWYPGKGGGSITTFRYPPVVGKEESTDELGMLVDDARAWATM